MSLTTEDVKIIKNLLRDEIRPVRSDVSELKTDVKNIDKRLVHTEQCVFDLADMFTEVKDSIGHVQTDVTRLTVLQEEQADKISVLFELSTDSRDKILSLYKDRDLLHELKLNYSIVSLTTQTNTRAIKELQKEIKK